MDDQDQEVDQEEVEIPTEFDSIEDELAFWKDHAEVLRIRVREIGLEIDEFGLRAGEVELELEAANDLLTEENRDLQEKVGRLERDLQEEKERAKRSEKNHNDNATSLQRAVDNLTRENESAKRAVVQLEQGNDDLETKTRNAHSSFLDMQSMHNRLLEEKVLLEEDLANKQRLQEEVQRLKDEVRDQASDIVYLKTQIEMLSARQSPSSASADRTPQRPVSMAGESTTSINQLAPRDSSFMSPVVEGNSLDISPVSPIFAIGISSGTPPSASKRHSGIPLRALSTYAYLDTPSPPAKPSWGAHRTHALDPPSRQQHQPAGQRSPLGMAPGRSANLNASTSSMTRSGTLTYIAGHVDPVHRHQQQERPRRLDSIASSRTITNMTPYTTGGPRARVFSTAAKPRGRIANHAEALASRAGSTAPGTSKAGQAMQALRKQASQVQLRVSSAVHKPRPAAVRHSSPGLEGGDLTTISSGSPGGWTHVARSKSPDKIDGKASGGRQGSRLKFGGEEGDGDSTIMPDEEPSRSSQKTLPSRPGIPSPYRTRSQISASTSRTSTFVARSPPEHEFRDYTTSASSSGSSTSAPRPPATESRLPMLTNRPSSRASNYDDAPPRSSSRLAQSTSGRPSQLSSRIAFPASNSTNAIPSRPSSRNEGRFPRLNVHDHQGGSAPKPSPELTSSQSGLPRSTRRISTGPGLNKSQNGPPAGGSSSGIPVSRRSVSGRPASMGHFQTTPPPPVPQVAAQYRTRAEVNKADLSREEMIGLGLPVPPKKRLASNTRMGFVM